MHFKRNSIVILIVLSLVIGLSMTSVPNMNLGAIQCPPINTGMETTFQNINELNDKHFTISQATENGIIEPVAIRQSGYQTTSLSRGRTDTGTNTQGNITIDDANGWFVNQTEIEVTNLARLYGVNGTFDDGTDPWIAYSYDGGSNTQINSYNSSEGYVVCRNMGQYFSLFGGYYRHSESTEVGWAQVVTNIPESLDFRLEFEFRYTTGPIDPDGDDSFDGDIGVFWQLGTEGYYYPMQELDSRDTWYSVSHDFSVAPGTSTFSIYLGLYIAVGNVRAYINQDYDDDPLGEPDGEANAQNVTVCIDNVEFTSITPPGFDVVDFTFHAGGLSASVTGPGTGVASITNPDYWTADPLEYQVTSNTSVAFTYSITSLFQRYINSSWSTSLNNRGVAYSIASGQSSNLTFYAYVTQSSTYQDATIDIVIPSDWENATIWDPLMNDITGLCEVTQGRIHVPTSELSRSGWWEINLNGLNYIKNTSVQVFDHSLSTWSESSLFRPGNDTRVQLEIGTLDTIPEGGSPTNISWLMPDESPWTVDSVTTMIDGAVTSSVWTFGSTNTTAGEWSIDVLWTNGTEIAFESVSFALFHSASIAVTYPIIEANYGEVISNLITLRDADRNEYLLDDTVSIVANWSGLNIIFTQDFAKNWWEADFDTALIEGGRFTVDVNASRPYFDDVSIQFTVIVVYQTSLRFAGDVTSTRVPFAETYNLTVYYEQSNPTGAVQGASITVLSSDITGLEMHVVEYTGFYVISIRGYAIGSWILSVVANKTDYRSATKQFVIEVEEIDTTVQGSSPLETLLIGKSYTFTFSYIFESNSSDIHGATVLALGEAADWVSYLELGSGQYSVNLTPLELGEHFVILTFERMGFETSSYRLAFTVERVPITIEVLQGLSAPELSQSTILVRLSEIGTGLPVSGVQVFCYIIDPNGAPSDSIPLEETNTAGDYSAVISMPAAEGTYLLQITCDAENHVLESAYSVQLQPGRDALTMLWVATARYYPFMILLAALGVGLVYRRRARRRRIRENKEALAVKRRFDFVKSLLGVIVLHKESGLPVYSKILRVGLEETVISAFITAITSFRGEFDIESDSEEWGLIPISDIVRVISTNRLVCAFITTGNPSPEQRERMIRFAKTVAFIFDETLHDVPIVVLDKHTKTQFDTLFEDILDGALLRTYKLDDAKKLPTNTCALERIARKQGVEFKLEELASEIATCGLEEGRVYKAIMTALENHFLVTTDESPFTADLIRASETVEDES